MPGGKVGQWGASAQSDGRAEFKPIAVTTSSTANQLTDAIFTNALPESNPRGPLLVRNPNAVAKIFFKIDGAVAVAGIDTDFLLDPGESIIIPAQVTAIRFISDTVTQFVHLMLFW